MVLKDGLSDDEFKNLIERLSYRKQYNQEVITLDAVKESLQELGLSDLLMDNDIEEVRRQVNKEFNKQQRKNYLIFASVLLVLTFPLSALGQSLSFDQAKELDVFWEPIQVGNILQKLNVTNIDVINTLQTILYEGSERNRLEDHNSLVSHLSISSDSKTLASTDGYTIKLETGDNYPVDSVSINAKGKILASAIGKRIKIWNLETGKEILALKGNNRIGSVSISADGKTLASGGEKNMIKVWNLKTGKEVHTLKGNNLGISSVSISANGKIVASLNRDKEITVWNVNTGKKLRTIKGNAKFVYSPVTMSISADGKILASSGGMLMIDRTIEVWNLETGEKIHTLRPRDHVSSMSISSDGKTLATSEGVQEGAANTIQVWNLKTGKEIYTLRGHDDQILSVSMSANGKILASGSSDKTVKVWNIETGQAIATLRGYDDSVLTVSMSADGKTLASGSGKGTIKVWYLDLDSLVQRNCNWVSNYLQNNRNVSESDRHLCNGISSRK